MVDAVTPSMMAIMGVLSLALDVVATINITILQCQSMTTNNQRITSSPLDNDVDEIVLDGIQLHVERMDDGTVWMAAYRDGVKSRLTFWFTAERKGELRTSAYWEGDPWPDVRHEAHRWPRIEEDR
jgi:hypothetical protein